ncbi:SLC13 family permease [Siminovitchia fortis]|uniref:Sodium-dependent dicarboxylate transporter SdcS n=1 Tax=Siminovitchia fortis TaxID=254758 RepID=A0A443IMD1_9BACI|nr:DASS family sodium-coupled anion symporter [Siminovitchia fortis]RWR06323.1 DASS family sodium-coupled anion symporter [Siminovitchia fortis]WHY82171.1 DASS family sodium-coupled anion symporter [Siminovitchia fortis]
MERSHVLSAWEALWKSHQRTKDLLMFAMPGKKAADKYKNKSEQNDRADQQKRDGKGPSSYKTSQKVGLILGPLLFILTQLFFVPEGLSTEGKSVLAVTLWVATWWVTEAIPIPAASLLPIILLPMTGAMAGSDVTASYGDPIVFLFLGGFFIAIAMEKWNLHKRIALTIISLIGTKVQRIVLGFMVATGFLSMWVSNTAAVMMMIPIGTAIVYQASVAMKGSSQANAEDNRNFEKAIILAIGYSGTIGGLGTLIGTPPNIILAATVNKLFGVQISFAGWMAFATPVVIIMIIATWIYITKFAFPVKLKELPGGKQLIEKEKTALGKISFEETMVLLVFLFAAFMWITRTFLWENVIGITTLSDTLIAILAAVILFLIPAKKGKGRLLEWDSAKDIPWGILLLFGGGLSIAGGFIDTGLAEWMGTQLTVLQGVHFILIILLSTALVLGLTEFTSNTATATMILPVLASLALAINVHPFALMVPAAMAANCAFMLPVGTPPNAIMFATGKLKIIEMIRAGFWVNVFTLILIVAFVFLILPVLWGVDLTVYPAAFK